MVIRPFVSTDLPALAKMRMTLWPDASADEIPATTFVADTGDALVGFVEVGLRSHADGCDPAHPVGFIEGWFVEEGWRGRGVGRQLIAAAEDWARKQGCREMASDTWIDNEPSQRAHEALGYEVVDRCVNYRKAL